MRLPRWLSRATPDYAGLTSKEAKSDAIAVARKTRDLDAMWAAWEERGHSRDGLLYAEVLARKQELGAVLSPDDTHALRIASVKRAHGSRLPPIIGGRT